MTRTGEPLQYSGGVLLGGIREGITGWPIEATRLTRVLMSRSKQGAVREAQPVISTRARKGWFAPHCVQSA